MIERLCRSVQPLSGPSKERLGRLAKCMKLEKGERLLKEGEVCRYFWYLEKGMVRLFYNKRGRDLTEHFAYENGIFLSLESFFKQQPSRLMIEALEPAVVYGFDYGGFHRLMDEDREIREFYCKILEKSLIESQQKADACRFETAKERYERLLREHPEVVRRAPLIHIASRLGMSPETLSRVRAGRL